MAPKKYIYVEPTPPADLIDSSSFTVDFTDQKFVRVGLDPSRGFTVVMQIITPARHKVVYPDFYFKRAFQYNGDILTSVLDTPQKYNQEYISKLVVDRTVYYGVQERKHANDRIQNSQQMQSYAYS